MKFNLVGDTTGLPLVTAGLGLYVPKHRRDSANRMWEALVSTETVKGSITTLLDPP